MGPRQKCLGNSTPRNQPANYKLASMGPRQKCLGNEEVEPYTRTSLFSFNGAETKMSRKSDIRFEIKNKFTGFNGAETKMSRKFFHDVVVVSYSCMLQWGRDKNVSEMSGEIRWDFAGPAASMGPRQKCLGNITLGDMWRSRFLCFNGAETKMSRKSYNPTIIRE